MANDQKHLLLIDKRSVWLRPMLFYPAAHDLPPSSQCLRFSAHVSPARLHYS